MAKFIRIKDSLINVDKVTNFDLNIEEILIYFEDSPSDPMNIVCANKHEAALIFDDIPHLIDSNYIPDSVREHQLNELKWRAHCAEAKAMMDDFNYDELPF